MADPLGTAQNLLGGISPGSMWGLMSKFLILLLLVIIFGVVIYMIIMNKKFFKSVTFFRKNASTGKFMPVLKTKAMPIRLDSYGNIAFKLKKPIDTKDTIRRLKLEVSPNTHWVAIGEDGKFMELEGFHDIDMDRREFKAKFRDDEGELGRSSMHNLFDERHDKQSFVEKHGALMINVGAITVIMVFLWLIADKLIELVGQIGGMLVKMGDLVDAQNSVLEALDNIITTSNLIK